MEFNAKVRTCFWFDGNGHEAAAFYVSLLPGSFIENVVPHEGEGAPHVVEFTLAGAPMMVLNGGPEFSHSEAASISVLTSDQEETDNLWTALSADGGAPGRCGWVKDKYGVSWQIVPKALPEMLSANDGEAAERTMTAMMQMQKLDIAALTAAFNGE